LLDSGKHRRRSTRGPADDHNADDPDCVCAFVVVFLFVVGFAGFFSVVDTASKRKAKNTNRPR